MLIAFLLVAWSLFFTAATVGLQRNEQQWLPITLDPQVLADYSVNPASRPRLARINPEVIEAVKQDQTMLERPSADTHRDNRDISVERHPDPDVYEHGHTNRYPRAPGSTDGYAAARDANEHIPAGRYTDRYPDAN